jgi:hypothetical protein
MAPLKAQDGVTEIAVNGNKNQRKRKGIKNVS